MLTLILRVILAILAFQLIGALIRRARKRPERTVPPGAKREDVDQEDYSELTPYEIEDAEFEELPDKKD